MLYFEPNEKAWTRKFNSKYEVLDESKRAKAEHRLFEYTLSFAKAHNSRLVELRMYWEDALLKGVAIFAEEMKDVQVSTRNDG